MSYWFGARAVWPGTPFVAGVFTAGAVALSFVIPSLPAGIGVFHAVVVVALSLFKVPIEAAFACAIICHAFQLGAVMVLAGAAIVSQGIRVRSLREMRGTKP
jgi:uncharacterized membrane protein YbhN (UPF0104 family)